MFIHQFPRAEDTGPILAGNAELRIGSEADSDEDGVVRLEELLRRDAARTVVGRDLHAGAHLHAELLDPRDLVERVVCGELVGCDPGRVEAARQAALLEDHGVVAPTLPGDVRAAQRIMNALETAGIAFADVNHVLEEEGIGKFVTSLDKLLAVLAQKRRTLAGGSRASADTMHRLEP